MRPTRWTSYISSLVLLVILGGAAHAVERRLLVGSETRVTVNELLTLLGILPGSNTTVKVSTSASSGFGNSATLTADGALACRVDGTEVVLAAPHGPPSTGTCYAKVCTTTLALITLCDTAKLDVRSVACLESGPSAVDPGCAAEAPVCTGGDTPQCVGCQRDSDCGSASGAFGLGLGEVTTVTSNLLHGLLGLDLLVPLSTLKVSSTVNGPFSNEAVLGADATCSVGADGSISLAAGNVAGESTCFVQACVPLLGTCLVVPLDLIVDGCLLGQACDPIAACDTTTNTCISCRDDHAAGDIDRGCSTGTPTCHGAGSQASCVECEVDADCAGSTLDVALGPNRSLTVELARILDVLRQSTSLVPSSVKVGASLDGPFSNQTTFAADAALTGCAVDQNGNVVLTAAAVSGHVTCNVQVCATLLGNTVQTCLVVPIDATVDVCVLDNSCDLAPTCQADLTCGGCKDTKPPGGVDRGCSNDTPACGEGTCNECLADADCNPKTPLLDLDLGGVGEVLFSDILASLHLPVLANIDSVKVAANVTGPFTNDTLLDVNGDVAHCTVDLDNNVELVASTTVYGFATCNVEVCVTLLTGNVHTCFVVPVDLNVDPCASRGDCRPPLCDGTSNTCETCVDTGPGTDRGCSDDLPACITELTGDRRCVECDTDADCGSGEYCGDDNTCKTCEDDTSGGVDTGCTETTRACDTQPLAGGEPICVECTEDADCASTVCDEPTRTCKPCEDSATGNAVDHGCDEALPICDTSAATSGGAERCVECTEDAHCAATETCLLTDNICVPRDSVLARDDQYSTAFASVLTVTAAQGVLANDRAPGGAALTATLVAASNPDPSSVGTLTLAVDGSFTFAPVPGFSGPASFQYDAQAATGLPARATVVIEVTQNRPPLASDEWVTTPQDTAILIAVLANDVDPDGHALGVPSATDPIFGDLAILDDATILYTPPAGFVGRDAFTYEACDPYGACHEGTVLVTVTPVNHAPMAADDQLFLRPNSAGVVDVLANDGDPDGDALVIGEIDADEFNGTIERVDGGLRVTPLKDALGTFTFAYDACDTAGLCDRATVLVEVGETPPDPVVIANDDNAETMKNLAVEIDVLENDLLVGDGSLWIGAWNRGAHGVVTMTIDNALVYRPDTGFVGEDAFLYTACDGRGHCASATVTINVLRGDNTPPVALDDLASTRVDTAVVLSPIDNDFDADGDALMVHSVGVAGHGVATLLGDGTVQYAPGAGFVGVDTFEVEISDGEAYATSTVKVLVLAADNRDPVARDDGFEVDGVPAAEPSGPPSAPGLTTYRLDVLANDMDPDGDILRIDAVTQPTHATATLFVGGGIAYSPVPGYVGVDRFSYRVSDNRGGFATAQVTVLVGRPNLEPSAGDDVLATPEDTASTIDVLANDSDPDGEPLTVTVTTDPRHGTLVPDGAGLRYEPAADFFGDDAFTYSACDPRGACAAATVDITVTPVNDGPIAIADHGTAESGTTLRLTVLANDIDVDGDALGVASVTEPNMGTVTILDDGRLELVIPPSVGGVLLFNYDACDPSGLCDTALVTVDIEHVSVAPTAVDDTAATDARTPRSIDVLANDNDPDNDTLEVREVRIPRWGLAEIENNLVVYTPDGEHLGVDQFEYVACDLGGLCATAKVSVEIGVPTGNRAPIAVDDRYDARVTTSHIIDVLANDSDPDEDPIRVTTVVAGQHGQVSIAADGKLLYAPDVTATGEDTIVYTVCDTWNACASATVTIVLPGPEQAQFMVSGGPDCAAGGGMGGLALGIGVALLLARRTRSRGASAR